MVLRASMSNKFRVEYEAPQPCLNEGQSSQDLEKDYEETGVNKLKDRIMEKVPKIPTGKRLFYVTHSGKTGCHNREGKDETSMKLNLIANSVDNFMFAGLPLQPLL